MDNIIATTENREAYELHQRIIVNASMAVSSWVESCKCLKQMRDGKLYTQLGYSSFEDYTVKALNIKERQAYTYIQAYEKLGNQFLQSNADLGITKLSLLTAVPVMERQELVDNNDIAGMTVEEVKKLVAENDKRGEQISLLTEEVEQLKTEREDKTRNLEDLEGEVEDLKTQLDKERNKPTETVVEPMSDEQLETIRSEARKEAEKELAEEKKQLSAKIKAEKEKAVEKTKKELESVKAELAESNNAKDAAIAHAGELEKKLLVTASPETTKFTFYFESLQADYSKIFESLIKIKSENPETASKYENALCKYLDMIAQRLKNE